MADSYQLYYIINHVFLPPKLPQECDESEENYAALSRMVLHCAEQYQNTVPDEEKAIWDSIVNMLEKLCLLEVLGGFCKENIENIILQMNEGDVIALLIREQNAGIIIRGLEGRTLFESFEVSPDNESIMSTNGRLICTYPGPAISVPAETARDVHFVSELSNFLTQMNFDPIDDAIPTTWKAGSEVGEIRDTTHPRYITELLTGILRGVGCSEEVPRISKRIADDILWKDALLPWRRSPIWLLIRVSLATTLHRSHGDLRLYKSFMAFTMAQILRGAVSAGLESDLLSCMSKKISRRLYKLGSDAPKFLTEEILDVCTLTNGLLQKRWDAEQKRHAGASYVGWVPKSLDIAADTRLSMTNSRAYIEKVFKGSNSAVSSSSFTPAERPRFRKLALYDPNTLEQAYFDHGILALTDFERAVEDGIDSWVAMRLRDESACATLSMWMKTYSEKAEKEYRGDPEAISFMFLTLFELWVGLDKLCTKQCPLMQDYSPEVTESILEPLLLRPSDSFSRLKKVLQYVRERHARATHSESIFSGSITSRSFAIRYFDSSRAHQDLKARIETKADADRRSKVEELTRMNNRHKALKDEARKLEHKMQFINQKGRPVCGKGCKKCRLERKASALRIKVFEWPLPGGALEAKATVFELDCPFPFGIWRDATYYLLRDRCSPEEIRKVPKKTKAEKLLQDYQSLLSFRPSPFSAKRITFASSTKSFLDAHYKRRSIPCLEDRVCLKNALRLRLYDASEGVWVSNPFADCTIRRKCTYQIEGGHYYNLQYAIDCTDHTPNTVMANQSECNQDLTLHEYIAFATLRSGPSIQWLNILRELSSGNLTFRRVEVEMLLLQAAFQTGPLTSGSEWGWHAELCQPRFGAALLEQLRRLKSTVSASWMEVSSMRTIIALTRRILSSGDSMLCRAAFSLLKDARHVAYGWMDQLRTRLKDTTDEVALGPLQISLCELAATFRSTYDLDRRHYPELFTCDDDLSCFLFAGMILRDNTPNLLKGVPRIVRQLLERDRRLSHSLQSIIARVILANGHGLDQAIKGLWSFYNSTSQWRQLPAPNDRWLYSRSGSQVVHIDLLSNQLLVDGRPPSRLPLKITSHPTYARIFGEAILDIIPPDSSERDVQFATSHLISDNQVFFVMTSDELVIRAKCADRRLELIPNHKLSGDLPLFLVEDYAHWLDFSDGVIELRPLDNLWISSADNWRIDVQKSRMWRSSSFGQIWLVDTRSRTTNMLANRLSCLEDKQYLTIAHTEGGRLFVDLPRYRLSFLLEDSGDLACESLPDMIVDENQSAGTFIGLRNQLVLRSKLQDELDREVIVPIGEVCFQQASTNNHTTVTITQGSARRVQYYRYQVDRLLGRLVGNTGLHGRLYKIYLHAVTSHTLPDPLTGRTGTGQSLRELQSAACRSFQSLDDDSRSLLHALSSLTPCRVYYPPDLTVMQTVHWNDLPPTAQHDGFAGTCEAILEFASQLQVFARTDGSPDKPKIDERSSDQSLLCRSATRTFCYYPPEYQPQRAIEDVRYVSRDVNHDPNQLPEDQVLRDASLILSWPPRLATTPRLMEIFKEWTQLSGYDGNTSGLSLSYCRRWIDEGLPQHFLTVYNLCRIKVISRYQLLFTFCAMGYGHKGTETRSLLPTLLSFATTDLFGVQAMKPPVWEAFTLSAGFEPGRQQLVNVARANCLSFEKSFAVNIERRHGESDRELSSRRQSRYQQVAAEETLAIVDFLINQWPCKVPLPPTTTAYLVLNVGKFMETARSMFLQWYQNHDLSLFTGRVQNLLDSIRVVKSPRSRQVPKGYYNRSRPDRNHVKLLLPNFKQLLRRDPPHLDSRDHIFSEIGFSSHNKHECSSENVDQFHSLLGDLRGSGASIHSQFAGSLEDSLKAFQIESAFTPCEENLDAEAVLVAKLNADVSSSRQLFDIVLSEIRSTLSPRSGAEVAASLSGLWPRLTVASLLEKLPSACENRWLCALQQLARSILLFQRSRRLQRLYSLPGKEDFWKEMETPPTIIGEIEDSDWLLMQVDGDFLVRPVQLHVAHEMIAPAKCENTLLQLNMGEGKSAVIVPMVAATLADGTKLPRILVLRSLATQMFSLLVERLGGLTNKQILYLPFSRDTAIGETQVQLIRNVYEQALASRAILIAQPEHVLSYNLMTVDHLLSSRTQVESRVARQLMEAQLWLEANARDVLDESDEILHVRYQLIYTVGAQQSLELGQERWTTIQQVLSVVRECIPVVINSFPLGVEILDAGHDGSYPHIRLLEAEVGDFLVTHISQKIIDGALENCSFSLFTLEARKLAYIFIRNETLSAKDTRILKRHCSETAWKNLLLLRGILGHRVLVYVLKERRWRVDYGLDPSRTPLAVPYRAKDVPSLRAEFGHPDVAILLTCLSYYYGGLTEHQLAICFRMLYKLGNPKLEYEEWVAAGNQIPLSLHDLSGVNVGDLQQRERQLLPLFRFNRAVINFYLSHVVFPKAAKEFPHKLTVTGWDLARTKAHVTTGFSGTNDSRYLLPTSIHQADQRLSTNAKVLSLLLRPENNYYLPPSTPKGQRLSGYEIINSITGWRSEKDAEIRVLLDVGAQILEMTNIQVASYWLCRRRDVEAAIFFNKQDQPEVLTKDGMTELLTLSPYYQQMDKCVVYLDDAHTRGTDLKLPAHWKACVTLGPKVTKDRLAQGCMRMRKLGFGQSLLFMAPHEIDKAIREKAQKQEGDPVTNLDILRWAMDESCNEIERQVPRWLHQGLDYAARSKTWEAVPSSSYDTLRSSWLQPEARKLEAMYLDSSPNSSCLYEKACSIPEIRERCESLGVTSRLDPHLEEEQEREVHQEIEEEPQKERPPKAKAAVHHIRSDVKTFIASGRVPLHSPVFSSVFAPLRDGVGTLQRFQDLMTPEIRIESLLATQDFLTTIQTDTNGNGDYIRPVNWVVSGKDGVLVVLSPYEVNQLLPSIRQSKHVHLHLYTPRTTKFMKSVDDLKLYSIPPLPLSWKAPSQTVLDLLNLAAGQLYFSDYPAYSRVCALLGICTPEDQKKNVRVQSDGFIRPENRVGVVKETCLFSASPLPYLKMLTGFRRKDQTYASTHLGKILHTRFLQRDAFNQEFE
ncbi:hypothetical protein Moror_12444 [Moniliophthora roreri MCA 2997]|uniref:ubiquitinyl hydrolase 1 n=1 Tax=Moniliophthora roreri (strain MCA 2997) TaxID=1381753 RepID=V2XQ22_MONRO|nr:hypothetical protein Moror_12444 [Moniliophthora roreri MCA 2997]